MCTDCQVELCKPTWTARQSLSIATLNQWADVVLWLVGVCEVHSSMLLSTTLRSLFTYSSLWHTESRRQPADWPTFGQLDSLGKSIESSLIYVVFCATPVHSNGWHSNKLVACFQNRLKIPVAQLSSTLRYCTRAWPSSGLWPGMGPGMGVACLPCHANARWPIELPLHGLYHIHPGIRRYRTSFSSRSWANIHFSTVVLSLQVFFFLLPSCGAYQATSRRSLRYVARTDCSVSYIINLVLLDEAIRRWQSSWLHFVS